jgi:hypothetical protein
MIEEHQIDCALFADPMRGECDCERCPCGALLGTDHDCRADTVAMDTEDMMSFVHAMATLEPER